MVAGAVLRWVVLRLFFQGAAPLPAGLAGPLDDVGGVAGKMDHGTMNHGAMSMPDMDMTNEAGGTAHGDHEGHAQ